MIDQYKKLKEAEIKLDEAIRQKVLLIEEEHNTRLKCIKTLRFFLSQKVKDNYYNFRLDGKVLNDMRNKTEMKTSELLKRVIIIFDDLYEESNYQTQNNNVLDVKKINSLDDTLSDDLNSQLSKETNFSQKSTIDENKKIEPIDKTENEETTENTVTFKLDSVPYNGNTKVFEWHSDLYPKENEFDSFELRTDIIPKNIKIVIEFDNSKDLVKLSEPLQKILKIHTTTKTKALIEFWKYVRLNKLINQDGTLKMINDIISAIPYDHENKKTTTDSSLSLEKITWLMNRYCFLDPDYFSFSIPVKDYERVFDIKIEKDDLTDQPTFYRSNQKNIYLLDSKIDHVLENIKNVRERIEMLDLFIENPTKFFEKHYFENLANEGAYVNDSKIQQCIFEILQNLEK